MWVDQLLWAFILKGKRLTRLASHAFPEVLVYIHAQGSCTYASEVVSLIPDPEKDSHTTTSSSSSSSNLHKHSPVKPSQGKNLNNLLHLRVSPDIMLYFAGTVTKMLSSYAQYMYLPAGNP